MRYAAQLEGAAGRALPPVDDWAPDYSGELDLVIQSDGVWVHEGEPIRRASLVRLFATILRREGDRHFLVTPMEKLGVRVEDAPFLAIRLDVEARGEAGQRLRFTTNLGDQTVAGPRHPLEFRAQPTDDTPAPYIRVRGGLEAKVARAPYFDLVDVGEIRTHDGRKTFGVVSDSVFFPMSDEAEAISQ